MKKNYLWTDQKKKEEWGKYSDFYKVCSIKIECQPTSSCCRHRKHLLNFLFSEHQNFSVFYLSFSQTPWVIVFMINLSLAVLIKDQMRDTSILLTLTLELVVVVFFFWIIFANTTLTILLIALIQLWHNPFSEDNFILHWKTGVIFFCAG